MTDPPSLAVEDLTSAVESALWSYSPIRESLSELRVSVSPDGRVEVSGPVRSSLVKDGVLNAVRLVPNVTGIVDGIVADNELQIQVALALAVDPRLNGMPPGAIAVHSHLGEVTLVGRLASEDQRAAAFEAARQVVGVRSVVDRISTE